MNISVTSTLYVNMKKDSMKLYDQQRWYHKWIEFFQHPLNQSHAGDTAWSIYRWKSLRRKYSTWFQVATSDNRTAVISRCVCLLWQAVSESSLWETPKGSSFSKKSLGLEVWSALSSHLVHKICVWRNSDWTLCIKHDDSRWCGKVKFWAKT